MGGKGSKGKAAPDSKETSITFDGNDATVETKTKAEVDATIKEEKRQSKKAKKEPKKEKPAKKKGSSAAEDDEEDMKRRKEEAAKKIALAKQSKKIAGRLGGNLGLDLDNENQKKEREKLFSAPKGPERSKIYNALNPQKLYYESRREREEAEEEKEVLEFSSKDYGFHLGDDGNMLEEDDDEEEDDNYDPNNLPDFGEFQKVMDARQAAREEKQREHQAKLKAAYDKKKQEEQALRDAEVARIKAFEKELESKKETQKDGFVEEAQARVAEETAESLKRFSFY